MHTSLGLLGRFKFTVKLNIKFGGYKLNKHCCENMKENIEFKCSVHDNAFDCPDCLISYNDKWDQYGVIIHDGGKSSILINYCPWCGKKLPESKRDLWFDKLEALGYENPFLEEIPEIFETGQWYESNKS